jgi:hypothetical protein
MTPQKKTLQAIRETGQAQGAAKATMASLERKGHIRAKGAGWELTKRGASYLEGKLGNAENLKPAKRGKVKNPNQKNKDQSFGDFFGFKQSEKAKKDEAPKSTYVIHFWHSLGDTGAEYCYGTLPEAIEKAEELNSDNPWNYYITDRNNNVVFDKEIKKQKVKNPGGYGDHGPEERAALRKARAFYGDDALVTHPKPLRGYVAPNAAVEIGELVAIEYDSNKFDGEPRIYRHDVTKKRKMFISIDGSTIIIQPPLKVTKRGIEG